MIKPKDGYVVAVKHKDTSKGYTVEKPYYKDVHSDRLFYSPAYELVINDKGQDYFIIREDTIIAEEVTEATNE